MDEATSIARSTPSSPRTRNSVTEHTIYHDASLKNELRWYIQGWRISMKKTTNNKLKPRTLEFKKETVANLGTAALENVVGGNNSTRPSQCPTLCF